VAGPATQLRQPRKAAKQSDDRLVGTEYPSEPLQVWAVLFDPIIRLTGVRPVRSTVGGSMPPNPFRALASAASEPDLLRSLMCSGRPGITRYHCASRVLTISWHFVINLRFSLLEARRRYAKAWPGSMPSLSVKVPSARFMRTPVRQAADRLLISSDLARLTDR
jgi:hypothetical protein